jgi:hypothetical protein
MVSWESDFQRFSRKPLNVVGISSSLGNPKIKLKPILYSTRLEEVDMVGFEPTTSASLAQEYPNIG